MFKGLFNSAPKKGNEFKYTAFKMLMEFLNEDINI